MYDPEGSPLDPRLQGYGLIEREYHELPARELTDDWLAVRSEVLQLELRLEEGRLRLWDPAEQRYLQTLEESERANKVATARIAEIEAALKEVRRPHNPSH